MLSKKKIVAVIFGGASQEHDVSVVSAQQLMDAADVRDIEVLPIYVDFENRFFSGPDLRTISKFNPSPKNCVEIEFEWSDNGPAIKFKNSERSTPIDCALPVLHGPYGEDGRLQGYLELIGIPTVGFNAINSAIAMRKDATKAVVSNAGVNVLNDIAVSQADLNNFSELKSRIDREIGFPAIVKPAHLGSSIGVGIAEDHVTLVELLKNVLRLDNLALIEPKVNNLREFNIAMIWSTSDNAIKFSAIESPKTDAELLDFSEKYLSNDGGGKKGGFQPSEGMLSLTRDINPNIPLELKNTIHKYASSAFRSLGLRGAPRIDFMLDQDTNEIWFNEINPIPGSYGFFLWEAADEPLLYPELIDHLVQEAITSSLKTFDDTVPEGARLLRR